MKKSLNLKDCLKFERDRGNAYKAAMVALESDLKLTINALNFYVKWGNSGDRTKTVTNIGAIAKKTLGRLRTNK